MPSTSWFLYRLTFMITCLWMITVLNAAVPSNNSCALHIDQYEKHHNIPQGLLHAISKVESGRKDDTGRIVAWPWTVNAEGQGYYFHTKEAAIKAVQRMQLKGVK